MISFQQVFSDLSTLLIFFPDVTAEMTVEELLIWLKDILENAGNIDFVALVEEQDNEDKPTESTENS